MSLRTGMIMSEQISLHPTKSSVSRDRLVVRTLRCGRSNPGSNPGHGIFIFIYLYFISIYLFFFSLTEEFNKKLSMCGSINTTGALRNHLVHREKIPNQGNWLSQRASSSLPRPLAWGWGKKWKQMRRPGIEPGSTAWKAAMLTIIPPTLRLGTLPYRW